MSVRTARMEEDRMTMVVLMEAIRISRMMKEGRRDRVCAMVCLCDERRKNDFIDYVVRVVSQAREAILPKLISFQPYSFQRS